MIVFCQRRESRTLSPSPGEDRSKDEETSESTSSCNLGS